MRLRYLLALVAGIILSSSGCQDSRPHNQPDPIDEGNRLIDAGNYSLAIQNLSALSAVDKRPQVLVALGSAHAAQGGIRVKQYWNFLLSFKETPTVKDERPPTGSVMDSLFKAAGQNKTKTEKKMNALGGLAKTSSIWEQYKDRIAVIPSVRGEQIKDLQNAIDVLAQVKTPGGRLYRALLNLVLFKSYAEQSDEFWNSFNQVIGDVVNGNIVVLCDFEFDPLLKWLGPITHHLGEALMDLTIAYPDKAMDFVIGKNLVHAIYVTTQDGIQELRDKRMCK